MCSSINTWFMTSFPCGPVGRESACNAGDLIPRSGRSPGEGNDKLLQCSCLENPVDRRAWRVTVYWVAESDMTERLNTCTYWPAESLHPSPTHWTGPCETCIPIITWSTAMFRTFLYLYWPADTLPPAAADKFLHRIPLQSQLPPVLWFPGHYPASLDTEAFGLLTYCFDFAEGYKLNARQKSQMNENLHRSTLRSERFLRNMTVTVLSTVSPPLPISHYPTLCSV